MWAQMWAKWWSLRGHVEPETATTIRTYSRTNDWPIRSHEAGDEPRGSTSVVAPLVTSEWVFSSVAAEHWPTRETPSPKL